MKSKEATIGLFLEKNTFLVESENGILGTALMFEERKEMRYVTKILNCNSSL